MSIERKLLTVSRGSVTAPAGCGKTHLIATALIHHEAPLPALILTHTNAGASVLRQRIRNLGVASKSYRVSTIDGLAKRLAATFPRHSGINAHTLELTNPRVDYPAIQQCSIALLQGGHLDDVLPATYDRVFVDEYQDCSKTQHQIVLGLARTLPTCVLGDPMQAIFGFAGPLVDWKTDVRACFPSIGELDVPWRWINAHEEELGDWLLEARGALEQGTKIDLTDAPPQVQYIHNPDDDEDIRRDAAVQARSISADGSILVIGESINVSGRHRLASQVPGATIVEPVDLRDLTRFGSSFDITADNAAERLLVFASKSMTGLDVSHTLRRLETLRAGRERSPPSPVEYALLELEKERTYKSAHTAVRYMRDFRGVRVFRPEVIHRLLRSLEAAANGSCSFKETTINERERFRHRCRPLSARNIGSTLLLKGLEAEVVVILYPEKMDAQNLYVALSRASHRIIICSGTPLLPIRA